jgi:DTW domain-containing protein
MHRVESTKLTNTGRLVPKLARERRARDRRHHAIPPAAHPRDGERRLLLFPSPNARSSGPSSGAMGRVTLVVPDGSWSQARRIAQHELRRADVELVSLPDPGTSRYRLRRKPVEGGLATLEAIAHALGALEGPEVEEHLLRAFDRFVGIHRELRAGEGARLGNELARARALALAAPALESGTESDA